MSPHPSLVMARVYRPGSYPAAILGVVGSVHRPIGCQARRTREAHRPGAVRRRCRAGWRDSRGDDSKSRCARTNRGIPFDPSIDWSEYTIVTAADIPGVNVVELITDDQPYLADGDVNHAEEPVVLIAHRDPRARRRRAPPRDDRDRAAPAVLTIDERSPAARSSGAPTTSSRATASRRATSTRRSPPDAVDRRRGVRDRRAGAALHRAERHDRGRRSRRTA